MYKIVVGITKETWGKCGIKTVLFASSKTRSKNYHNLYLISKTYSTINLQHFLEGRFTKVA